MLNAPRTAGRRSLPPLPFQTSAPALLPAHSVLAPVSVSDALTTRAVITRTRDELWDDIRALTEADVRPANYAESLAQMNAALLAVQMRLTTVDRWLAAQPAAA